MNDLDLLDRFGPKPTQLSATALAAARARLDAAMTDAAGSRTRPRRRLPILAAAAAAAVGLAVTPALIGSGGSVALATVDPMTFPLTPAVLPSGLGEPVFEQDANFMAARYGSALNSVSIVTGVDDEDFWAVPDNAPTTDIDGHKASVVHRTVHNGTLDSAPAVTVVWRGDHDWTAVTGTGSYADAGQIETIAESMKDQPQQVDLTLSVAPKGWSVVAYKEDRILTLAAPDDGGAKELTVSLVDRLDRDLSGYAAHDVETVTINGARAQLGRQAAEGADSDWILEARTSSGQPFSLQAPAALTRHQVIEVAEGVTYRP
ncbi:hypothetical protein SAMN05421678_103158 [Actinopolymorpha cephalotaxi]|uniref:Uncharacterized protein n=1 Tax=Actinopolymorpha cephalotaxi TaxID=504797 RepID=A0A1I2N3T1_9ACTN|nr:hypothetical protein [Actinopolymorpha cephalotaxi]NYH85737.1 hypothetical protein [Actinopolymorpha cephalotaxi]SFF97509.1 hypothetical protein SAMN05421678_103158 [Actinopolymorpha cephalotaxi]